jgi:hypothetical protein
MASTGKKAGKPSAHLSGAGRGARKATAAARKPARAAKKKTTPKATARKASTRKAPARKATAPKKARAKAAARPRRRAVEEHAPLAMPGLGEEDQIRAAKFLPRELPKRLFEEDRFLFPESRRRRRSPRATSSVRAAPATPSGASTIVREFEERDNVFPEIDYRVYRVYR